MQEAKFVLREPKATGATLIQLFYNFDRQRLKLSTKLSIPPAQWSADKQRAFTTGKMALNADLNAQLDQMKAAVEKAYSHLKRDQEYVTPTELKAAYAVELEKQRGGKRPTATLVTLADFAERLTEELQESRAASTLQVYRSTIQHLRDFEKHSRRRYDFASINLDFYNGFTGFLQKVKGHSPNTVGKIVKTCKSFMTEAAERKLHTNLDYKLKRFKVDKTETDAIYLSVPELQTLADLDLPAGSPIANVRDLFVFGAFTGLRFSDSATLAKVAISGTTGRKTLKIRSQKTDTVSVIPLHPLAEAVLEKNGGHPPKAYSNPATNRILKQLGQLAGFTDLIEVITGTGKQRVTATYQKWEMVTCHTARRSFASNCYLAGLPLPAIMAMTGHAKTQTFMSYIRITAAENAEQLLNHSFFQSN